MTTVLVCHAQIVMALSHGVHEHMFQVAQLRYGERIERACRLKGAYFVFGDVYSHSEPNRAHLWHDACMRLWHVARARVKAVPHGRSGGDSGATRIHPPQRRHT